MNYNKRIIIGEIVAILFAFGMLGLYMSPMFQQEERTPTVATPDPLHIQGGEKATPIAQNILHPYPFTKVQTNQCEVLVKDSRSVDVTAGGILGIMIVPMDDHGNAAGPSIIASMITLVDTTFCVGNKNGGMVIQPIPKIPGAPSELPSSGAPIY